MYIYVYTYTYTHTHVYMYTYGYHAHSGRGVARLGVQGDGSHPLACCHQPLLAIPHRAAPALT